ncbi:hypothetical protein J7L65_04925 [Candidatus Bathyarchaeota archaeon]|nr:hypothetical protein [Candidatus Bathyarchaeota archaeon]
MPVRSYIFTRNERERLLRWLEEGFEDDTTRMIFVEIRRNMPRLFRDLTLMLRVMRELMRRDRWDQRLRLPRKREERLKALRKLAELL